MNATDFLHESSATDFLRGGAKKETPFIYKALDFLTGHFPEAGVTEELVNGGPNPKFTGDASVSFLNQPGLALAAGGVGGFKAAGSIVKKLATGAAEAAGWATGGVSDVPKLAKGGVKGIIKAVEAKPLAELRATREASGIAHATVPITADTGKPIVESLANTAPKTAKDFLNEDTLKVEKAEVTGTKTGTRKEIVEKEIADSGRPEIDRPINQSFTPDDIKAKVDSGEIKPRELAEELSKKSRALSGDEINALGYDRAILKNEHASLEKLIDDARIKGDADAEIKLLDEQSKIYELQKKNDLALSVSGEEWARAGHSLQKEIAEDYSFSNMQRQAEKTLGRELNVAEKQKYKNLSKQIEEADLKIKQYEDQIAAFKSQKAVGRIRNEVALERRKMGRVTTKIELDTEFDSLAKELNATLSSLHANPFADPKATILLGKMAKNRVKAGVVTMEGLVDEVYTAVKNLGYEVSKREVRDAISQYGVTAQLSKDEINVQLRELRRQMRLTSALEDAQKGVTPLRSGLLRDAKTEKVLSLEKEVKQAMRENGIDVTKIRSDEEQWKTALQSYKTRTTNRIKELEQKMQAGDFLPKKRRELVMDKQALDLKFKKDKVVKAYQKARAEDTLARRSFLTKAKDTGMEVLNVARAIKTSMDLSAVLRQGAFIALGHPIRGIKAMPSMFKALRSEKGQFAVEQEIMHRANYPLYEQAKLYLSEHGAKLSTMEEAYMSHWADKIPGVAASGRAYTTYLNRLRADSFDAMLKNLPTVAGKASPEETKAIANFINVATGRGNLGAKENALVGLNTVFFAPRYVASRFQLVMGQPFKGGTSTTKKMVAKEYARFLTGLGVVYAIGKAAGADIEIDPRSSDFGKLRFGKTRIDPMAGLSQTTVFMTRALTGQTKPVGKKAHTMDSRAYIDVYSRFARSKIAPVPGTALNWKAGQDVVGNKIKPIGTAEDFLEGKSVPSNLVMPLAISDIYDTMREQGVPKGSAMALLSIFGMGLQTYDKRR